MVVIVVFEMIEAENFLIEIVLVGALVVPVIGAVVECAFAAAKIVVAGVTAAGLKIAA